MWGKNGEKVELLDADALDQAVWVVENNVNLELECLTYIRDRDRDQNFLLITTTTRMADNEDLLQLLNAHGDTFMQSFGEIPSAESRKRKRDIEETKSESSEEEWTGITIIQSDEELSGDDGMSLIASAIDAYCI